MAVRNRPGAKSDPAPESTTSEIGQESGPVTGLPSLDTLEDSDVSLTEIRREPNPYAGITRDPRVLDAEKPKRLPVADADQAKKVTALLRRDATENGVGLSVDTVSREGAMFVVFRSKSTKRKLEHTSAVIRAWALQQDPPLPVEIGKTTNGKGEPITSTRLPKSTRDAYREAHGLKASASK